MTVDKILIKRLGLITLIKSNHDRRRTHETVGILIVFRDEVASSKAHTKASRSIKFALLPALLLAKLCASRSGNASGSKSSD